MLTHPDRQDALKYEYCGVLHIHSRYSDGGGTTKKIIEAARSAGLDYIVITDHNTLQAMEDGAEGWHDDVLVLVGSELGNDKGSHYLALGISEVIAPEEHSQDVRPYIKQVEDQNGIGFAAHPQGLHNLSFDIHLAAWNAWDEPNYTGMEIWSYMRDWADGVKQYNILYYYFRPEKIIKGPSPDILRKWDELCRSRRIAGIGGADAHAHHLTPFNLLQFLSYKRVFRGIRTHLLTPSPLNSDLNESKKLVYTALKLGHCFFAHDFLADSRGFSFKAFTDEGQVLFMGDEAGLKSGARLEVASPASASLRLIHNGQPVKEADETHQLEWRTDKPGVYRIEARYNNKPWVFTNPIYLRGEEEGQGGKKRQWDKERRGQGDIP